MAATMGTTEKTSQESRVLTGERLFGFPILTITSATRFSWKWEQTEVFERFVRDRLGEIPRVTMHTRITPLLEELDLVRFRDIKTATGQVLGDIIEKKVRRKLGTVVADYWRGAGGRLKTETGVKTERPAATHNQPPGERARLKTETGVKIERQSRPATTHKKPPSERPVARAGISGAIRATGAIRARTPRRSPGLAGKKPADDAWAVPVSSSDEADGGVDDKGGLRARRAKKQLARRRRATTLASAPVKPETRDPSRMGSNIRGPPLDAASLKRLEKEEEEVLSQLKATRKQLEVTWTMEKNLVARWEGIRRQINESRLDNPSGGSSRGGGEHDRSSLQSSEGDGLYLLSWASRAVDALASFSDAPADFEMLVD